MESRDPSPGNNPMTIRLKPWTIGAFLGGTLCILFVVGIATHHLTKKTYTHHGDPHHITSGRDMANHTDYENTHPHAMDHIDNDTGHSHSSRSTPGRDSSKTTPCQGPEWECNIRLETEVYPAHYDVYLNPQTEKGTFEGRVAMTLNVSKAVDHLRVHMKDLEITSTFLYRGTNEIKIEEVLVYEPNEFLVFKLTTPLIPDQYKLIIQFKGNLTRGVVGLYRSQYVDPGTNATHFVVASKFQPTYARRAFPCMDEPGFKSTFSVSLVKPANLTALSNMPISEQERDKPAKGFNLVHFEKSVPMVTYLLAVAIGDFSSKMASSKRGVSVRVFSTRFQVEKTEYALSVVPRMIDFYEQYFDIKYPLPKMDIIGIPDFVSGAMEHWGLISFRESNLLYQPGVSSAYNKQRIVSVLAHEIAHMWFGNLMTLKWWSDLWLNEGFASYCEYKAVHHVHPEWEIESQFVSLDLTPVLVLDGQQSSHPIVQEVSNPDQITEIFDTISYNKGASVIRMLEYYMGPELFQKGVSRFLKAFSYSNAVTQDLWDALQSEVEGNKTNIILLMDTWTRQMGYPVLRTEIKNDFINITQNRYVANPNKQYRQTDSPFAYSWEIPLRIQAGNDSKTLKNVLMRHTQDFVVLPIPPGTKWVKLNSDYFGYFRVQYAEGTWRGIKDVFLKSFTPKERCGLIDDIFSFAYSQNLNYDLALDFGRALQRDVHLVPWDCADDHLKQISSLLENSAPDTYFYFRKYITNVTSIIYKHFNWVDTDAENHLDRLLKAKIFSLSCSHGHPPCLETAHKMFNDWIQKGVAVPPGLRPIVYKWGMWQASEEVWNVVWSRYMRESDAQERVRLLNALASTQQSWILRRFINLAGNATLVKRQDFFTAMNYVSQNPVGNPIVWLFYRNEYDSLLKRFTANDRYFGRMILSITSGYSSQVRLQEMEQLFKIYPAAGAGKRARETALETVKNNIEWQKRNVPIISQWLKSNEP